MRTSRRSPANSLTRSLCNPAQFTTKSPSKSPAVVSATQPDPRPRSAVTRAEVTTRFPAFVMSSSIVAQTFA